MDYAFGFLFVWGTISAVIVLAFCCTGAVVLAMLDDALTALRRWWENRNP